MTTKTQLTLLQIYKGTILKVATGLPFSKKNVGYGQIWYPHKLEIQIDHIGIVKCQLATQDAICPYQINMPVTFKLKQYFPQYDEFSVDILQNREDTPTSEKKTVENNESTNEIDVRLRSIQIAATFAQFRQDMNKADVFAMADEIYDYAYRQYAPF